MRKASLPVCILLLQLTALPLQAKSLYEAGLERYKTGHYKEAANCFAAASRQEPSRQNLRYLLANCLVQMNQQKRAVEEYEAAYYIDPYSSIAGYCRQALQAYKISLPDAASLEKAGTTYGELDKVKSLIKNQTSFEKGKHGLIAARSTQLIKSHIDDQIKRVDQQMQMDIQKLYEPLIFTPGPRANPMLAFPDLLKEKESQIRQAAQAEKASLAQEGSARSQVYETWRKGREALLDETADNLQDQLDKPAGPSGIKLQAHGTGLYVRNYAITGTSKVPETHSATARFSDLNQDSTDAASSSSAPKTGAQNEVKGTLLREAEQQKSYGMQM